MGASRCTRDGSRRRRRERKKLATRAALRRAALRLAVRDGVEHVTVERIADEADIALRTFFNYFSSKEEAVLATAAVGAEALVARFRARPPEESVLHALREAVLEVMDRDDVAGDEHLAVLRLIRSAPSLLPQQLSVLAAQERAWRRRSPSDSPSRRTPRTPGCARPRRSPPCASSSTAGWTGRAGRRRPVRSTVLRREVGEAFASARARASTAGSGSLTRTNAAGAAGSSAGWTGRGRPSSRRRRRARSACRRGRTRAPAPR